MDGEGEGSGGDEPATQPDVIDDVFGDAPATQDFTFEEEGRDEEDGPKVVFVRVTTHPTTGAEDAFVTHEMEVAYERDGVERSIGRAANCAASIAQDETRADGRQPTSRHHADLLMRASGMYLRCRPKTSGLVIWLPTKPDIPVYRPAPAGEHEEVKVRLTDGMVVAFGMVNMGGQPLAHAGSRYRVRVLGEVGRQTVAPTPAGEDMEGAAAANSSGPTNAGAPSLLTPRVQEQRRMAMAMADSAKRQAEAITTAADARTTLGNIKAQAHGQLMAARGGSGGGGGAAEELPPRNNTTSHASAARAAAAGNTRNCQKRQYDAAFNRRDAGAQRDLSNGRLGLGVALPTPPHGRGGGGGKGGG
eukprot:CAMPEP_0119542818 /NCGR_PEP_ID=MMETSP1344-20130328/53794_1 /TAXON_ID=236787 /ORGANISM="Florenciella parvula, Strain CCMP2471" /LENGTH=360 /DNA_ID=CAMNT_0007587081 /DNA_START=249 /DNA_END=1327 /DNA_ORIENTATION=-